MTTYKAKFYGDIYQLRADFSQASDSILRDDEDGKWVATGKQVADFGHRSEDAMRWELDQAVLASGDSPYDADDDPEGVNNEFADAIETAIENMTSAE